MSTIIIGAGASGLALAVKLKMICKNEDVTVLEHLDKIGKKILATGNGRCNMSNENASNTEEVLDFFNSLGLVAKADEQGRIYPYSMKATTVQSLLIDACDKYNVIIKTSENVLSVLKPDKKYVVKCDSGNTYKADYCVIATGGKAQPKLGSDGSGYRLLQSLNHTITPLCPALVQLTSSNKILHKLSGMRVKGNVTIEFDGEKSADEYGEILFTDYGLSGIVIMDLSLKVSANFQCKEPKKCIASIDLVPNMSKDDIKSHIEKFGNCAGIVGYEIDSIISKQSDNDIEKYAAIIKGWRFIITGTKGFNFAQVTLGGAKRDEFDDNFQSKKSGRLFACGEVLENTFKCGGYNLNFAFYSGLTAAKEISKQICEDKK